MPDGGERPPAPLFGFARPFHPRVGGPLVAQRERDARGPWGATVGGHADAAGWIEDIERE
eukprot:8787531-Pyramimonas_sp.AAC.1